MRLLIVTQAVDQDDQALGFFHGWIEKFAQKCAHIDVVCLKEDRHSLPSHVSVHSLGKESATGHGAVQRLRYSMRFLRLIWNLRHEYDTVFVHMNAEYMLLGGLLWRALGKRIGFWRNHVLPNWQAAIGIRLADVVFYVSPQTYAARFAHAHQMPAGIDVDQYTQASGRPRENTVLFLGRLDGVKRLDLFLEAIDLLAKENAGVCADIIGDPTPGREKYASDLREKYKALEENGTITYSHSVPHDVTRQLYQTHRVYVNLTPPGSFDKTILEAMTSGCLVVASNPALKHVIDPRLFVADMKAETVAEAISSALQFSSEHYEKETGKLKTYVRQEHSLDTLVTKVLGHLKGDL